MADIRANFFMIARMVQNDQGSLPDARFWLFFIKFSDMSDMQDPEDFLHESQTLLRDYVQTRLEILRLQGIRAFAQAAGTLIWAILLLFLLFMFLIFTGLVLGFWFSSLFDSYVAGFGLATGVLLLTGILLTMLRKALFINPIIRTMVRQLQEESPADEKDDE